MTNFKKDILKIRNNIEYFLTVFNEIEIIKINYITNNNIKVLYNFLKQNDYDSISFKIDLRKYTINLFNKEKKKILKIIENKITAQMLSIKDKEEIYLFLTKIYISNKIFEKNNTIYPILNIQKNITEMIIICNFELINSIVNNKMNIKLIKNNQEEIYTDLLKILMESICRYEKKYNTKFITFLWNRLNMVITEFISIKIRHLKISNSFNYEMLKLTKTDLDNIEVYDLKENIYNTIDIFKLLNINLSNEFDYNLTKKEILKIFNAIIENTKKIELENKTFLINNPRKIFIDEFKILFPTEYNKYKIDNNDSLISRRLIDLIYFNKELSLNNSQFYKKPEENYFQIVDTTNDIEKVEDLIQIEALKTFIGFELFKEDIFKNLSNFKLSKKDFSLKNEIDYSFYEINKKTNSFTKLLLLLNSKLIISSKELEIINNFFISRLYDLFIFNNIFLSKDKIKLNIIEFINSKEFKDFFYNIPKNYKILSLVDDIVNEKIDNVEIKYKTILMKYYLKFKNINN